MAEMTEEEADALDEFWTKNTPQIRKGGGGFFTERRNKMLILDEETVRIIDARALSARQTPAEFIADLVRKDQINSEFVTEN